MHIAYIMYTYYSLNQVKQMEICKEDIWKLLFFQYKLGVYASKAIQSICPSAFSSQTAYNWYKRFKNEEFPIERQVSFWITYDNGFGLSETTYPRRAEDDCAIDRRRPWCLL